MITFDQASEAFTFGPVGNGWSASAGGPGVSGIGGSFTIEYAGSFVNRCQFASHHAAHRSASLWKSLLLNAMLRRPAHQVHEVELVLVELLAGDRSQCPGDLTKWHPEAELLAAVLAIACSGRASA